MVELADTLDLGSSGRPWGFKSLYAQDVYKRQAVDNTEEGGDDVKSSCPLCPGLHTCYNGRNRERRDREVEQNSKTDPSSDCRLQLACMKSELLVIADQNAAVLSLIHI